LGEVKNPHTIILRPHITEKSMAATYGDPRIQNEKDLVRSYTFIVDPSANKIEIKAAIESIYNEGKKKGETIQVAQVRTVTLPGKAKRVRSKAKMYPPVGMTPKRKKAIVTLAKGQILEDYGV
jgi:large subunit ribosomal protein L23